MKNWFLLGFIFLLTIPVFSEIKPSYHTIDFSYELQERNNHASQYQFEIFRPGKLVIETRWQGSSNGLTLQLFGPGQKKFYSYQDGPSPLLIDFDISDEILELGTQWKIVIINRNANGRAFGRTWITYPTIPLSEDWQNIVRSSISLDMTPSDENSFDPQSSSHPQVSIHLEPKYAQPGENVHLIVSASSLTGINQIHWQTINSGIPTLDKLHTLEVDGLNEISHTWTLQIDNPGRYIFKAGALDAVGKIDDKNSKFPAETELTIRLLPQTTQTPTLPDNAELIQPLIPTPAPKKEMTLPEGVQIPSMEQEKLTTENQKMPTITEDIKIQPQKKLSLEEKPPILKNQAKKITEAPSEIETEQSNEIQNPKEIYQQDQLDIKPIEEIKPIMIEKDKSKKDEVEIPPSPDFSQLLDLYEE